MSNDTTGSIEGDDNQQVDDGNVQEREPSSALHATTTVTTAMDCTARSDTCNEPHDNEHANETADTTAPAKTPPVKAPCVVREYATSSARCLSQYGC
jgi:hypothetical protein